MERLTQEEIRARCETGEAVDGRLADGTRVRFRRARPGDRARLRQGFARLSTQSRYRRFLSPLRDLRPAVLDYLTAADFEKHCAWIAELPGPIGHPGVGIGHWFRSATGTSAEVAVTVVDEYQGLGIGKALLWLLAETALGKGVRTFTATVLAENRPALRIASEITGAGQAPSKAGEVELAISLPAEAELWTRLPSVLGGR